MKSLSLRTASAKQRGLAAVFPVNNSLRRDMKEWERASSKCGEQSLHYQENHSPAAAFTVA